MKLHVLTSAGSCCSHPQQHHSPNDTYNSISDNITVLSLQTFNWNQTIIQLSVGGWPGGQPMANNKMCLLDLHHPNNPPLQQSVIKHSLLLSFLSQQKIILSLKQKEADFK